MTRQIESHIHIIFYHILFYRKLINCNFSRSKNVHILIFMVALYVEIPDCLTSYSRPIMTSQKYTYPLSARSILALFAPVAIETSYRSLYVILYYTVMINTRTQLSLLPQYKNLYCVSTVITSQLY